MIITLTDPYQIEVAETLREYRHWEDGEMRPYEIYTIHVYLPRGEVYQLNGFSAANAVPEYDDENGVIYMVRDETAYDRAAALAARIRTAGRVNLDHWTHVRDSYGSEAYQSNGGDAEMIAWEKKMAEEEAWS